MKVGDMKVLHTPKMCFLAWKDKKIVTMLSTMHVPTMIGTNKTNKLTRQEVMKPNVVISYNDNMGGVDLKDQSLSAYKILRKTIKWYHKLYFHAIDIAIHNALAIYNQLHPEKKMRHLDFRRALINELLAKHCETSKKEKQTPSHENILPDFSKMHFPTELLDSQSEKVTRKRCIVCSTLGVRKDVKLMCKECIMFN